MQQLFGLTFSVAKLLKRLEEPCTPLLLFFKRKTHAATMNMLKGGNCLQSSLAQSPSSHHVLCSCSGERKLHVATVSVQAAVRCLLIIFPAWQAFSLFKWKAHCATMNSEQRLLHSNPLLYCSLSPKRRFSHRVETQGFDWACIYSQSQHSLN